RHERHQRQPDTEQRHQHGAGSPCRSASGTVSSAPRSRTTSSTNWSTHRVYPAPTPLTGANTAPAAPSRAGGGEGRAGLGTGREHGPRRDVRGSDEEHGPQV